jgi:ATP-dependent Clp protease adaptor protein ClpS
MVKEKLFPSKHKDAEASEVREIVLYNDDFNTFDFVIETLIDVCGHDENQAEQCTLIVHFNGKCAVKSGSFTELKPPYKEMQTRGLTVTIE